MVEDVIVKKFTFAILSPGEFLVNLRNGRSIRVNQHLFLVDAESVLIFEVSSANYYL